MIEVRTGRADGAALRARLQQAATAAVTAPGLRGATTRNEH